MRALALALLLLSPSWSLGAPAPRVRVPVQVRTAPVAGYSRPLPSRSIRAPLAGLPTVLPLPSHNRPRGRALPIPSVRVEGRELFDRVHELSGRGFRSLGYGEARRYMFAVAANVEVNGVRGVIEAYSQTFVPGKGDQGEDYPEDGDQNHDGWIDAAGMNTEHLWPQSFFASRSPMRSDMYHLLPTFIKINELRGSMPFGEVRGRPEYSNDAGAKIGQGVFEPPPIIKGWVARAVLYFYTHHHKRNITQGGFNDRFWNDKIEMLLRWNREHPPSEFERAWAAYIEKKQGNRNPFIDDPALADRIGVSGFTRTGRWGLGY